MLIVPNPKNPGNFLIPTSYLEDLEAWARENNVTYYTEPGVLGWSHLRISTNKEFFMLRWL